VAGILIVTQAICLGPSTLFVGDLTEWMGPLIRRTLEAGFEMMGWVVPWHPIQVLVFAPVASRVRPTAFRKRVTLNAATRATPP
jgi:hypothetical protein